MSEIITVKGDTVEHFENIEIASKKLGLDSIDVSNAILHGYKLNGYRFIWSEYI